MSVETPNLDWSEGRQLPLFQTVQHLDVFDLRGASPDHQLAASTCAGQVNHPRPCVYLILQESDQLWLEQLCSTLPQTRSAQKKEGAFFDLLDQYHSRLQGVVLYDPALPDTINVATTLAGQCGGMVISPALFESIREKYALPVLHDLRAFGWHSRLQAYFWAYQHLLDKASGRLLAGMHPSLMAGLRSFLVATRSFTCWLDATGVFPDVRAHLLSERALAARIFSAFPAGSLYLGWLPQEHSGVALLSRQAIPVLASDYSNNAEVWSALPSSLAPISTPAPIPALDVQPDKIYVSFTLSDGDNLQYCQNRMLKLWLDPARGSFPLGWTITPLLAEAAPAIAHYYQSTVTPHDELIAGPSGAGYMYPTHWPKSQLPAFLHRSGSLIQKAGLSTLTVLDSGTLAGTGIPRLSKLSPSAMAFARAGRRRHFADTLTPYGVRAMLTGIGYPWGTAARWRMINQLPVYRSLGLIQSVEQAVKILQGAANSRQRPLFLNLYVEAWPMGPTEIKQVLARLDSRYEVVLPSTLLATVAARSQ